MENEFLDRCYAAIGRASTAAPEERAAIIAKELAVFSPDERESAEAWMTYGTASRDPEIMRLKEELQETRLRLSQEETKNMENKEPRNWRMFIVGCVFLSVAIIAFFWAFSLGTITPDQRTLLLWILPLASGFGCGCFAGGLRVTGNIANFCIAASAGFGVWVLTFFCLKFTGK